MLAYPVELDHEGGMVIAVIPDVPGAHTFGVSETDALAQCVGAVEEMLAARMSDLEPIPAPSPPNGRPTVEVPTASALKLSLYELMRERQVSNGQLARSLGLRDGEVDRLLDLNHDVPLERIQAAFQVLGKRVAFRVEDVQTSMAA